MVDGVPEPPEIVIKENSQSMKGTVGDGGAPSKLVSYSGDLRISMKK